MSVKGSVTKINDKKITAPRLFGTDGIRGTANKFPMTAEIALKVGQAMGYLLRKHLEGKKEKVLVLIGKDTRISGYMVEQAMASGLNSMGVWVHLTGPLPTPGIGFLAQNMRADAGVVISASHNPYYDNGIKIFASDGFKIPDAMEREIEELVFCNQFDQYTIEPSLVGRTRRIDDAAGRYIVNAKNSFPLDQSLDGVRIVLDCAHGATYKVAPAIFEELGAEVIISGNEPNGFNINDEVGALHTDKASEMVLKYRADVAITLDGDGDRVIMVDETGKVINGDHILAICALHLKKEGQLRGNKVVATQMSNMGLQVLLAEHGIELVRTDVGDKHVVKMMREHNYALGGEQSGHIIFLDHSTTGDGCIAALKILAVMKKEGKTLSELASMMKVMPQILVNLRVKNKKELATLASYNDLIKRIENKLADKGRVFVRYSGTEPLVRILLEGSDAKVIKAYAEEIKNFLQDELC